MLSLSACAPQVPTSAVSASRALQQAPDGDLVVAAPLTVLNRYGRLGLAATRGDKQLILSAAKDLTDLNLQPGDLLMIMQPQGAQIQTADTDQYGVVTATQGAGLFEFIAVAAVDGTTNRVVLDAACGGLRNDYDPLGQAQVIRVPQYLSLTVNAGASVVARPWDGQVGGVVAVRAQQTLTVQGEISASGQGFRGGPAQPMGTNVADQSPDRTGFVFPAATSGGAKGESIAGFTPQYLLGGLGRGAPANGGGGGNAFKAGGGGGAGAGLPAAWSGQGVMPAGVTGAAAWKLDPAYAAANNQLTTSSGGGRGGYSASTTSLNPLTVGPGDPGWLGNLRRERGGRGGHPLAFDAGARLFLGGGGGAGDQNGLGAQSTLSGAGGSGGGLVYLVATTIRGNGTIAASGAPGSSTGAGSAAAQGAGGGGGGGAIVLNTTSVLGTLSVKAPGGDGGNHQSAGAGIGDANGPGGGGGGGFLAGPAVGAEVLLALDGGRGGTSTSGAMLSFPSNGATSGSAGNQQTLTAAAAAPLCTPAELTISVTPGQTETIPGGAITFTVVVTNHGPYDATGVQLHAALTPTLAAVAWSCTQDDPTLEAVNCADAPGDNYGDINKSLVLPAGQSVTFTVFADLPFDASGTLTYKATVTPPPYLQDLLPGNNTASGTTVIVEPADVQVQLLGAPNPSLSGEAITVTATVRNVGPLPARGLQLDLQLPVGVPVHRPPAGPGWTCAEVAADGKVTCTNPSLDVLLESEVWLALLPDFSATTLRVRAAVKSTSDDPDPTNNAATLEVPIAFNGPSYRTPAIGGGGFGCVLSGRGSIPLSPASATWSLLGLLLTGAWRSRRRHRPSASSPER